MENPKEYIESGILEAYYMGSLTPQEEAEVIKHIRENADIAAEAAKIEEALEHFAKEHATTPPAHIEGEILKQIKFPERKTATQIPLPVTPKKPVAAIAAAAAILIGSAFLNIAMWNKNKAMESDLAELHQRMDTLRKTNERLTALVVNYNKSRDMMADEGMKTVVMHTVLKGHPMAATLYISNAEKAAYVMINALPAPPEGMQYQLWAIKDGKSMDMGMIPGEIAGTAEVAKIPMPLVAGEAYAISLEKKGGSPSPTSEQIYVYGKG